MVRNTVVVDIPENPEVSFTSFCLSPDLPDRCLHLSGPVFLSAAFMCAQIYGDKRTKKAGEQGDARHEHMGRCEHNWKRLIKFIRPDPDWTAEEEYALRDLENSKFNLNPIVLAVDQAENPRARQPALAWLDAGDAGSDTTS
ncbi:hypothetical protein AJ78_06461, partial [Emergomyces pasteurianus Ep9510]